MNDMSPLKSERMPDGRMKRIFRDRETGQIIETGRRLNGGGVLIAIWLTDDIWFVVDS